MTFDIIFNMKTEEYLGKNVLVVMDRPLGSAPLNTALSMKLTTAISQEQFLETAKSWTPMSLERMFLLKVSTEKLLQLLEEQMTMTIN